MAYYGFIPEESFTITSVSSRNTADFQTKIGRFSYRHLKNNLFFGYKVISVGDISYKVGEAEKVILDYLYLNKLNREADFKEMRFNVFQINDLVDLNLLSEYRELFRSSTLDKRVKKFVKVIND